ncbi:MAG: type II toxin-antitoxin system MqsA family antitoxin [Deferrisomatales bacterium]|nr:type II toxin-antitoxin system MqsA family antitoxin [Deferrisomatales bacterium]
METRSARPGAMAPPEAPVPRCGNCGSEQVCSTTVRSAFWHGDRLVVVEDVPALVCDACHEQFYDDGTVVVLDLLQGDGFPPEQARRELRVPVFSFEDRARRRGSS